MNPSLFPYSNEAGERCFTIGEIPKEVASALAPTKLIATSTIACFLCKEEGIKLGKMREHVGRHILQAARCEDADPIGLEPCGFCGRDGEGCLTQLEIGQRGGLSVTSTCPYKFDGMKIKQERESTDNPPCSNVPIHCPMCPKSSSGHSKTIWKYNTVFHLADMHPDVPIPVSFLRNFFIHCAEEARMGIGQEETASFRERANMAGSDGLEAMEVDDFAPPVSSEIEPSVSRDRAGTVTQTSFDWYMHRQRQ